MNAMKKIWNIVTWVLVLCVTVLAVLLAGMRFLGFTPYAVLSASMTPTYQVGDLVYVKSVEPETIVTGDVITFVANEDLQVVTHRVAEADSGNRCFITKGDANTSNDAKPVLYENVLGVVKFAIPCLGYVSMYLSTTSGKYAAIAGICVVLLLFLLPELFGKDKKEE